MTFSSKPATAGSLTAVVTTNSAGSGTAVQVVRETGLFPFGFFAILFLAMFALRLFFWSSWRRRGPWGPGRGRVEDRFDEWHERRHDTEHRG